MLPIILLELFCRQSHYSPCFCVYPTPKMTPITDDLQAKQMEKVAFTSMAAHSLPEVKRCFMKLFHETVLKRVAMTLNMVEHFCLSYRQRILNIVASHGAVPLLTFFLRHVFFFPKGGFYTCYPMSFFFFFSMLPYLLIYDFKL